jgi:hypothetical protein
MELKRIPRDQIENFSGVLSRKILGKIPHLRKGRYVIQDIPVGGDAPKDFVSIYEYGNGVRRSPKSWPKYIAKVGHKWYPLESITEYLLNRVGEVVGLNMAKSTLYMVDEQLRFCSQYFLMPNESLIHGAQIYSACLQESDDSFVEEIEAAGLSKELFTFQLTKEAFDCTFGAEASEIFESFVEMLIFDALVGNNDRHFYNWGVITDVYGSSKPRFSPIYDTARGLFWNFSETNLAKYISPDGNVDKARLNKYIRNSQPKTGWEDQKNLNHFDLISKIGQEYPQYLVILARVVSSDNLQKIRTLLNSEFKHLLSDTRFTLVQSCLEERFDRLENLF